MHKQRGSIENEMGLAILIVIGLGLLVFGISRKLGADFGVTFDASWKTILAAIIVFGAVHLLNSWRFFIEGLLVWGALTWIFWWKVLDNIHQKNLPEFLWDTEVVQIPWWDSSWFKGGVELLILAALAFCIYKRHRDSYSHW